MQTSLSPVSDAKHWMFWRGLNRTTRIVCHPRLKPLYHLERLTQEEADEARQYRRGSPISAGRIIILVRQIPTYLRPITMSRSWPRQARAAQD